jgi:hypothetical protein
MSKTQLIFKTSLLELFVSCKYCAHVTFLSVKVVLERQRLTPVNLATQEAEIRRTTVQSQPGKIVHEILS